MTSRTSAQERFVALVCKDQGWDEDYGDVISAVIDAGVAHRDELLDLLVEVGMLEPNGVGALYLYHRTPRLVCEHEWRATGTGLRYLCRRCGEPRRLAPMSRGENLPL